MIKIKYVHSCIRLMSKSVQCISKHINVCVRKKKTKEKDGDSEGGLSL